ncbi:SDR family oxidoreductase [Streptomyces sp. MJP52]|uniref:SDR family oxidoreductase n=1 Tax=Streptomyces sp. MJP52 TaxID=2940555 RepID=UPI002474C0EC|nr:SDR family oxidoreductase [Streptomyces sp. MJP52]MDH6229354.1 uncharacterized protein YbjT (DUF2867 family) [Streptomyces sp. MJP52]
MILVTGATGTVGSEVLRRLPAGAEVRAMSRDPARVTAAGHAVEAVRGDHRDPRSLAAALRGVRRAFLVTNGVQGDDDARFLRAAGEAGVRHVVKLSAAAVLDRDAQDLVTRWQRSCEEALRTSGLEWTLLRPRAFMSNALGWAGSVRAEQVVRALHGTAVTSCVDPRDVAEVAVRALTEEGHGGSSYTLTGPEAISAAEQTRVLGRLLGRPLRFEELSRDHARAALRRRHPAPVAEALLESADRGRDGAKARVEDTVRTVTGHGARTFQDWARDHLAAFVPPPDLPRESTAARGTLDRNSMVPG